MLADGLQCPFLDGDSLHTRENVDKMLEDAAATIDVGKRTALYAQIQQRVLKDAVVVPLVDSVTHNAKRAEVQGDVIDALASYVYLYDVQIKK